MYDDDVPQPLACFIETLSLRGLSTKAKESRLPLRWTILTTGSKPGISKTRGELIGSTSCSRVI